MKTRILLMTSIVAIMFSCDLKKNDIAQRMADSLRAELTVNHKMTEEMVEIGILLDSIDVNRQVLRTHMVEGTNFESYTARMREINQYVRKTSRKIKALERTAKKSHNSGYAKVIKKLKSDLKIRNHELAVLREQVTRYKNENEELIRTVSLQKAELQDKVSQIQYKQEEIAQLESQVDQLLTQSKLDQGEAYFARAAAFEEAAKRTKFAPRKRKNTQKQALELYKLALFNGKDEALVKIAALEKML